ncbi:cysteine desulfurase family protein [Chelativorans composti]|jgi:Cysteine sulfinate desulfinase/cysteine desulfurase and related enzymes|uniref:Cysteine desulfurase n=1 Tax=Chelativorans composti TaxID=768533 RepID=A0ABW5DJL7_9HYPH|nr:cysteine desulfurase [bacterium SGD-2]
MTRRRIYLDYNATAPLLPAARQAMVDALDAANPSSVHAEGRAARHIVDQARRDVAVLVNAKPEHVIFTSGATEAANMLLAPNWQMGRSPVRYSRAYVSAADHPCVLAGGRFPPEAVEVLPVRPDGVIDLDALSRALAAHDASQGLPLVMIHSANNETGVLQPMREIAAIVRAAGGLMIFDAVQAAGRVLLDMSAGYADFLILSAHKIGGPKGVGAVVGQSDLLMPLPLIKGGGQERSHRAGTENVAGIAGFGAAAREALTGLAEIDAVQVRRERIERMIREAVPQAVIHGEGAGRLPNTVFFSMPGIKAETAQIALDLAGIAVSAGSACSSGKVGPSHVLKAMGYADAGGALRVSIGRDTTDEDVEAFGTALQKFIAGRRRAAPRERSWTRLRKLE